MPLGTLISVVAVEVVVVVVVVVVSTLVVAVDDGDAFDSDILCLKNMQREAGRETDGHVVCVFVCVFCKENIPTNWQKFLKETR
jgi:hypothetical protein